MKQFMIFFIILVFFLTSCGQDNDITEDEPVMQQPQINMSETTPDDFNFSVQYGIYKNNKIDTYDHTITKDLIEKGTATADFTFSNEEMDAIYQKMKMINLPERTDLTINTEGDTACMQEPYEEDEWEITMNGETMTLSYSEKNCELTPDAKELQQLRKYIVEIVQSKDEYQSLPAPTGGYD